METVSSGEPKTERKVVADVVCTACGCLCDDIELEVEADSVVEARNACATGRDAFLAYRPAEGPPCRIEGRPATIEEGIERAASLLAGSRYPLIFALDRTTAEGQRAAVSLAEAIGAVIDAGDGPTLDALRTVGEVTCTLGEVRHRADLIVVWRADPLESHPRLLSRYALDPIGEFVPAGRSGRFCVVIDTRETRSAREAADQFIRINEASEFDAIAILRAMVAGMAIDDGESVTGVPLAIWRGLSERMRACRYGALFYGAADAFPVTHGLHAMIRTLNETARFVCLPLIPGGGNAVGARNVLAWRLGFPAAVSLARGYPRHMPGEFGAAGVLERGEADAALVLSGAPGASLGQKAREHLLRIPRIVLTSDVDREEGHSVVFRTAAFGINTTGTVYRMDGVPLPLRTILSSPFPTDAEILRAIETRLRSGGPAPGGPHR